MKEKETKAKITFAERSPFGKGWYVVYFVIRTLLISLLFSIVLEFCVMKFMYPEQGASHSAQLLENEVGYLSENFRSVVFYGKTSAGLSIDVSNRVYEVLFVSSGLEEFDNRYRLAPLASESTAVKAIKNIYRDVRPYALASINIVQLFFVRLVVIALSLAAFLLITHAAVVDGIVQRDLRRYRGSIEQSWVHHYTKSWLGGPIIVLPAMLYLALPVNAPPAIVFMPSFAFFGLMIFIMITTYKKFV